MKKTIFLLLIVMLAAATVCLADTTKTALFVAQTGTITAGETYGADTNSVEITDPSLFICLKVEGLADGDHLNLMRENYSGTDWEYVTDGSGVVQLNKQRTSACPMEIGDYALQGDVSGEVTAYTEQ